MIDSIQQEIIVNQLKTINPTKIGVFGSFARNENKSESDLDILVFLDPKTKISLFDIIGVEQQLSEKLKMKVDLVTERSLSPLIRPYVEKDLKIIFE
jgi:predicted nucleotidyltransferase